MSPRDSSARRHQPPSELTRAHRCRQSTTIPVRPICGRDGTASSDWSRLWYNRPARNRREISPSPSPCAPTTAPRCLEPQLASLLAQTRLPDELVACDDGSTDGTVSILEAFARRAPFPVRIERNDVRLRSTRNFEKAIGLCTGDLIATSDQDDVWLPEKLALCEAAIDRGRAPRPCLHRRRGRGRRPSSAGVPAVGDDSVPPGARRRVRRGQPSTCSCVSGSSPARP